MNKSAMMLYFFLISFDHALNNHTRLGIKLMKFLIQVLFIGSGVRVAPGTISFPFGFFLLLDNLYGIRIGQQLR